MKCSHCNNNITIKIATKTGCRNCRILTEMISIITVQCGKCKKIFQVPLKSKNFFSIKKDE